MDIENFLAAYLNEQGQIKNKDLKKIVTQLKVVIRNKIKNKKVRRDELKKHLTNCGIASGIHYPIPIHHMECFKEFSFYYSKFPNAERFAYKTISVPVFPGMTETEVENVCKAIKEYSKTTSVESAHKLSQSA